MLYIHQGDESWFKGERQSALDVDLDAYDPNIAPDPEAWLALSEAEQIDLIQAYHEDEGVELEDEAMLIHAGLHATVESQAAAGLEPVQETLDRLMREGLGRHDAIHALAAIIGDELFNIAAGKQRSHDPKHYRKRLKKLSARKWLQGRY